MAVTAADTFANRDLAPDGWARRIKLKVALADAAPWQAVIPTLERALGFLSGDEWSLRIIGGGEEPPEARTRVQHKVSLAGSDCVCLYSGGLDSAIGALDLRSQGRRPVLVSHAYPRDAARQEELLSHLGGGVVRFATSAHPVARLGRGHDVQMRTRSFNFLAMGALMATALGGGRKTLFVPENGLIAINPPLTNRRIGALSTRTTHPHYLRLVQSVLDTVGIDVALVNPYAQMTKGEMMTNCAEQLRLGRMAKRTVSCGKWKRSGMQCGRCVPCLIRRASFHAAGRQDRTDYAPQAVDLLRYFESGKESDDLMAMMLACEALDDMDMEAWVAKTGPLHLAEGDRQARVAAVHRGMIEVRDFLGSHHLV
ncbi:MAG: hypothetical protein DI562_01985 [Stenotrophomonas acidaminiphila]|nr:MAG: hypothetical protein DI562_01985 [Stenotrophomonas acidaminiphila]